MNKGLHGVFSLFLSTALFISICVAQKPVVTDFQARFHPELPPDLHAVCLASPDSLRFSETCPVVAWNEYFYWVYSFNDNRDAMSIVAYTADGIVVKRWDYPGARYICNIVSDTSTKTFTLTGQARLKIVVPWKDIELLEPPEVGRVPSSVHGPVPDGCKLDCSTGPEGSTLDDSCHVVEWKEYTYWVYSYIDNRYAFNVVAYDEKRKIVKQWEMKGSRYLYNITLDYPGQSVTFWGQGKTSVTVKWTDLHIK